MAVFTPSAPPPVRSFAGAGLFLMGLGVCVALLYFGRAFCITLVISVILAFLLEPFVLGLMRLKIPRGGAAFLVCTMALLGLYSAGFVIVTQLAEFSDDLPYYSQRVNTIVDRVAERMQAAEKDLYRLIVPKRFQNPSVTGEQPAADPPRRRRRNDPPAPPPVQEVRIRQEPAPLLNNVYE
ncbi:MAG TPA: AI-2E family transporter, partial [Bryobacteraceae bacterium]|nr:AI-2E family transporter [Bryobacteraceae bacterium]